MQGMESQNINSVKAKRDINFNSYTNMLKSILPALVFSFLLFSCANKVDKVKAQQLAESFLTDMKNENYSSINKYYSDSFNESEPDEKKIEKFNRLKKVMGAIQSWELISSKENYNSVQGINQLELKYKVKCEKLTVEEIFLIINDEGDEKIIFQNIENLK
jgi:hypothetical protein